MLSSNNDDLKRIILPSFDPPEPTEDTEDKEEPPKVEPTENVEDKQELPQEPSKGVQQITEPGEPKQAQDLQPESLPKSETLPHLGVEAYESVRGQLYQDLQPIKEEILSEARKTKESIIQEGRQEKERLLQETLKELEEKKAALLGQAQEEAKGIRRRAYEEGRQEGILQAKKEFENEAKAQLEAFKAILREISTLKPKIAAECEGDIVELAVQVAQKVLQRELQLDPGSVLDIASRVLKDFEGRSGGVRVKLNPEDYDFIMKLDPKTLEDKGLNDVVFEKDPSLQRGGCMLETYQGRVDARIEKQLEIIKRRLLERVEHA